MSRTILVDSSSANRKLISLNLEVFVGTEIINLSNADEVIDFLKEDEDIQLIVCDNMVGDENTILKVYYYVNSNKLNIPIILMGRNVKLANEVEMIEKEEWKNIIRTAGKLLEMTAEKMVEKEVPQLFPIATRSFLPINKTNVDVYLQVQTDDFKIIFNKGDTIDKNLVRQFILDNEEFLYVEASERLNFTNYFSEQTVAYLKEEISPVDRINVTSSAFVSAIELINKTGLSEEAVTMAKASILSMVKISATSNGLSDLLEILQDSTDSYLYRHSLLVSMVGHQVINKMEWGNEEQKSKITFASFFHDVTIPMDNLCRINSNDELASAQLSEKDKKKVENHALNASELIKTFSSVPFGVDAIILQHHGALNGIGFKQDDMDNRVSPLAIVFIVVEEFVDYIMNTDKEFFSQSKVISLLRGRFNKGTYRKVVDALEEATSGH